MGREVDDRPIVTLLLTLLGLGLTAALALGSELSGPESVPEARLARFEVTGAPDGSTVIWDVHPVDVADVEVIGTRIVATAPPGTYKVVARVVACDESGAAKVVESLSKSFSVAAEAPDGPSDEPAPDGPDVPPGGYGFEAVAVSSSVLMPESDRAKAAAIYRNLADRSGEFPDHAEMKAATDRALAGAIDVSETSPADLFLGAVQARLQELWNVEIKSPADLAVAWREISRGLGG